MFPLAKRRRRRTFWRRAFCWKKPRMSNVGSVRDSYLCSFVCRFITDCYLLFYRGSAQLSVPVVLIPARSGFNVGASFEKSRRAFTGRCHKRADVSSNFMTHTHLIRTSKPNLVAHTYRGNLIARPQHIVVKRNKCKNKSVRRTKKVFR